ncbi:MAG: transposase, partial [Desulfovibrionales bacterium]
MDFPLAYSPLPQECYDFLVNLLHPESFRCPSGHSLEHSRIHRRHRMPVIDYQCRKCGKIFNVFTGTKLQGTKYSVTQIVQCFDGISRNVPIAHLAKEMAVCRESLGKLQARIKKLMPGPKEKRTAQEWSAILRDIERWGIEDC